MVSLEAPVFEIRFQEIRHYQMLLKMLPERVQEAIERAMRESHRAYHARWHLGRMWRLHCQYGDREWDKIVAYFVGFHDIKYETDIPGYDNKGESAKEFLRFAYEDKTLSDEDRNIIYSGILASKDHLNDSQPIIQNPIGAWLLDLDLEPLASEYFLENRQMIRFEYKSTPQDVFDKNTEYFLKHILESPVIFRTKIAQELGWLDKAKDNIQELLKSPSPSPSYDKF